MPAPWTLDFRQGIMRAAHAPLGPAKKVPRQRRKLLKRRAAKAKSIKNKIPNQPAKPSLRQAHALNTIEITRPNAQSVMNVLFGFRVTAFDELSVNHPDHVAPQQAPRLLLEPSAVLAPAQD
ncbi:MAG TPA: hypothetical protein DCS87_16700 [Rheinheimera sp.]|nr:hypothetical protein [Rheinheimera sp.]